MKKSILTLLAVNSLLASSYAQDLRNYIPNSSKVVLTINPEVVWNANNAKVLQNDFFNKPILNSLVRKFSDDVDNFDLSTIGINPNAKSYFFVDKQENISFETSIYSLIPNQTFHLAIAKLDGDLQRKGNFNVYKAGYKRYYVYNETTLFIVKVSKEYSYSNSYDDNNYPDVTTEMAIEAPNSVTYEVLDAASEAAEAAVEVQATEFVKDAEPTPPTKEASKSVSVKVTEEEKDIAVPSLSTLRAVSEKNDSPKEIDPSIPEKYAVESVEAYDDDEDEDDDVYEVAPMAYDPYDYDDAKESTLELAVSYIQSLHSQEVSILKDKNFTNSNVEKAYANVFVKNINEYLYPSLGYWFGYMYGKKQTINDNFLPEYYAANLELNDNDVSLNYEFKLNDEFAKKYKKVEQRKVSKRLLKYLNTDTDIAGMSVALNTENYLNYSYEQLKNIPYAYLNDEAKIITDIAELIIDEKAIGKAVKGDALFLITGMSQYNYKYTSYDYTEDFSYSKTTKDKQDVLPDLLYMYSTENPVIHMKIYDYLIKHKYVSKKDGIYSINTLDNDIPYSLHILIKDNIVFIGTNLQSIKDIAFDKYVSKANCKAKRNIRKNTMYGFFNPKLLSNKIKTDDLTTALKINNVVNNLGQFEWKHPKISKNKSKGTIKANINKNSDNGAQYLLNTIDNIIEMTK